MKIASPHLRGLAITATGVLVITPDSLLVRLIETDVWSLLFYRGLFVAMALSAFFAVHYRRETLGFIRAVGRVGILAGCLAAVSNILFVLSLTDIPHIPSKFVEIVPLSHRQGNCIPYAAIRWHDFGNRPALGRPLGHFSRHPDTPLLSLSPRRRFPRPKPERVFVADHQSSSGFSGTGPSAPPPQPIGT